MKITVEDLPRWHVLHDGLALPRGLSPAERGQPLRVIEYHVRVSRLGGETPACGYSTAVLAARTLGRRIHPWVEALVLAHCVGAIEMRK